MFQELFNTHNKKNNKNIEHRYELVSFPENNKNFGDFRGKYPKQAAEKAFTFLSNLSHDEIIKDGTFIVFNIQKKTKNTNNTNNNKLYKFIGTIIELENEVINNKGKVLKYKNIISKYNPDLDKIKKKEIINFNQ